MKFQETSPNLEINAQILKAPKGHHTFSGHIRALPTETIEKIKFDIQKYYFNKGWGLKILARNVLGITYTQCRVLFKILDLEFNKGRNVCNDFLRTFRKEKAINENLLNAGFNSPTISRRGKTDSRGVQGYYYNKSLDNYVWLRSTWEYIYAKFLNKIGINWKVEQTYYTLSDGARYCPDFYIYDKDWNLIQIVEIKGYWDNRAYKCQLLKEEYFNTSIVEIILIRDIKIYLEENLTYSRELQTWKTIRKSKEFIYQK